jgi:hypothetical protein
MPVRPLYVQVDAKRQPLRYHAERGNDQDGWLCIKPVGVSLLTNAEHHSAVMCRARSIRPDPLAPTGGSAVAFSIGSVRDRHQTQQLPAPHTELRIQHPAAVPFL